MPDEMAFGVMRLIAEGAGQDDADAVGNLRAQAVASYLKLLSKPSLPDVLLKACSCLSSEFGQASLSLSYALL